MVETILAPNSTMWEAAVEQVSATRWEQLDLDALRRAQDPWECPVHLLPWLAYNRGVDIWYDDWPELWKRRAIAEMPRLKKLKGTLAGIKGYLALMNVSSTYVVTPPADGFLADEISAEERAEWLALLPQIRIYPFRDLDAVLPGDGFIDIDFLVDDEDDGGGSCLHLDSAADFAGERLFIWQNGQEVPLTIVSQTSRRVRGRRIDVIQVMRPVRAFEGALDEESIDDAVLDDDVDAGLISMELTETGFRGDVAPVPYAARAVATPFELVFETVDIDSGDHFIDVDFLIDPDEDDGAYLDDEAGDLHVYRRAYLADPDVPVPDVEADFCLDDCIIGFPPFTAIVGVNLAEAVPDGEDAMVIGSSDGYLEDPDTTIVDRVVEAVRAAQGDTDEILIDTTTFRPLTVGDRPRLGDRLRVGQMIERTF